MRRAVFLDRDGTLNHLVPRGDGSWASPRAAAEFELAAGAEEVVARLKKAGFLVLVATNQPDVARGFLSPAQLEEMHRLLATRLAVDEILVCPHDDADGCACRKPLPGMLLEAARRRAIDLGRSFMVGDSWKDMEAARRAGVTGILIAAEYNQEVTCGLRAESLESACDYILRQGR
ncbi:hypothetical protein AAU61_00890 [Desulfocarbo indianensis]|nr:hypothetical protein AAU61_00890 [Desulfocarbo indianensis]